MASGPDWSPNKEIVAQQAAETERILAKLLEEPEEPPKKRKKREDKPPEPKKPPRKGWIANRSTEASASDSDAWGNWRSPLFALAAPSSSHPEAASSTAPAPAAAEAAAEEEEVQVESEEEAPAAAEEKPEKAGKGKGKGKKGEKKKKKKKSKAPWPRVKENSAGTWKDGRRSKEARSPRFLRGLIKLNLKRINPIPPAVQEALDKFEEEYGYEVPVPKGFGRNVHPKTPPGGPRQRPKRELSRRKRRPTSGSTSEEEEEEEEEPTAKAAAAAEEAAAPGAEPIALLPEVAAAAKPVGRVISVALATQEAALRRVRAGKATASNYRLRNAAIAQEIAERKSPARGCWSVRRASRAKARARRA